MKYVLSTFQPHNPVIHVRERYNTKELAETRMKTLFEGVLRGNKDVEESYIDSEHAHVIFANGHETNWNITEEEPLLYNI